jgi:ankyrin repeat protein
VEVLIEHTADVSAKDSDGRTALFWAARRGHESAARMLIEHQADVSSTNNFGRTPLSEAALAFPGLAGHAAVVRLLLDKGVDEQMRENDGRELESLATAGAYLHALFGPHRQIAAMMKAEGMRRAQCLAFAMGQHERLGEGSRVQSLDAGVVRMVLEQV